jgi:subtilisin-like proprotein convertase family protein
MAASKFLSFGKYAGAQDAAAHGPVFDTDWLFPYTATANTLDTPATTVISSVPPSTGEVPAPALAELSVAALKAGGSIFDGWQLPEDAEPALSGLSSVFDRMQNAPAAVVAIAQGPSSSAKTDTTSSVGGEVAQPDVIVTPSDAYFGQQWHLKGPYGINVQSVWNEYNGHGVRIGIVDDGVQYTHKDLNNNYRTDLDYDARNKDNDANSSAAGDMHGTTVAGVIAAEMNNDGNYGVVGVAWDADIAGFRMGFGTSGSNAQILDNMQHQKAMDISNNSWGFGGFFSDNFNTAAFSAIGSAIQDAAANGRGKLGTVFVFAAGNDRASGQDVNYHDFQNSPFTIAAAATDINGNITSFSTPGAAVLIAAPGLNIVTDDRTGSAGFVSGDFVSISGTSFSTPIISSVVALMLEANPLLGYRDVQEILAYSAAKPPGFLATDLTNDATNWNGGGLSYNHDYGFGLVDAHAAVRLAETWTQQSTFANEKTFTEVSSPHVAIPDGNATGISDTIGVSAGDLTSGNVLIDRVEVSLNISHTWIGDLIVSLTGPGGTTSTLVNRPGVSSSSVYGSSQDNIVFTTDSVHFWGETAQGNWMLTVKDMVSGDVGTLNSWSINFIGDYVSDNNTYIYTDSYATYLAENASRGILSDSNGGTDTINLSAVTGAVTLDLVAGHTSTIAGASLTITNDGIENAFLGDGSDTVRGNSADNVIFGGRGADQLWGGGGADTFDFDRLTDAGDVIHDFDAGDKLNIHDLFVDVGALAVLTQEQVDTNNNGVADDIVRIDPDGGGPATSVIIATILDHAALLAGDIIV